MKNVYKVTFNQYETDLRTNSTKIVNNESKNEIEVDMDGSLLVFEDDIELIKKYGNGIKTADCVGKMKETSIAKIEELAKWHWEASRVRSHGLRFLG